MRSLILAVTLAFACAAFGQLVPQRATALNTRLTTNKLNIVSRRALANVSILNSTGTISPPGATVELNLPTPATPPTASAPTNTYTPRTFQRGYMRVNLRTGGGVFVPAR